MFLDILFWFVYTSPISMITTKNILKRRLL